jgi:lipoprotein-releasing system permease protein
MQLSSKIAIRYLFGKKSTNAINWITWIVISGMAIGTAAMIISMSVFNGFENLISGLFNAYNPDLKVTPASGIYFNIDEHQIEDILEIKDIEAVSKVLQEVALFEYEGSQEAGYIKGVDKNFSKVTDVDSTLIRGNFILHENSISYGVLGVGMYNKLSVNPGDALTPITVYMPNKGKRGPLEKDYKSLSLYAKGVFSIGNEDDGQIIISNYDFVNRLLGNPGNISQLEIKTTEFFDEENVRKRLKAILGSDIVIKNRYEQDEAYLRIMNIEKFVAFLLVALTILIISFNLVGSLWMIVLDKKKDISILRSMGMTSNDIKSLFIRLGIFIGAMGLTIGIILALIIYFLQKQFGIVSVPPGFMIDSYPIDLKWIDFIATIFTVLIIAFIASLLPANRAKNISAYVRHE